ncbi:unnamed protein product [Discula destructiva]
MRYSKIISLALAAIAVAHPGHEEAEHRHAVESRANTQANKRALEGCAAQLQARGLSDRASERRRETVRKHREARGIPVDAPFSKRSTIGVLAKDHEGDINGAAAESDETLAFTSNTCTVLNPEGEVGPFYVLGEYVRSDIVDDEPGVSVVLDIQLIDVSTCEPLVGAWTDIWSANSTGVYGGVQSQGNGNYDDVTNLDSTALRGIQQVDDDGVTQFSTIFPGHYSGRTTHIHIVVHENATELANGTLTGGTVPHIGQFFFDQSLITKVYELTPYSTNNSTLTTNAEDRVFGEQETQGTTSDPVFDYVYIGDDLSDGLFSWIVVGVNPSAEYTPTYSFELTADGGEAVGSSGGGGFGGGSGPFGGS